MCRCKNHSAICKEPLLRYTKSAINDRSRCWHTTGLGQPWYEVTINSQITKSLQDFGFAVQQTVDVVSEQNDNYLDCDQFYYAF